MFESFRQARYRRAFKLLDGSTEGKKLLTTLVNNQKALSELDGIRSFLSNYGDIFDPVAFYRSFPKLIDANPLRIQIYRNPDLKPKGDKKFKQPQDPRPPFFTYFVQPKDHSGIFNTRKRKAEDYGVMTFDLFFHTPRDQDMMQKYMLSFPHDATSPNDYEHTTFSDVTLRCRDMSQKSMLNILKPTLPITITTLGQIGEQPLLDTRLKVYTKTDEHNLPFMPGITIKPNDYQLLNISMEVPDPKDPLRKTMTTLIGPSIEAYVAYRNGNI